MVVQHKDGATSWLCMVFRLYCHFYKFSPHIHSSPFLWLGSESRVGKKSLRFSSFASRRLPFLQCVSLLGGSWELIKIPLPYVPHLKFKIKRWNEWQPRKQTSDGTPVIISFCFTLSLDSCHSNYNFYFGFLVLSNAITWIWKVPKMVTKQQA